MNLARVESGRGVVIAGARTDTLKRTIDYSLMARWYQIFNTTAQGVCQHALITRE